MLCIVLFGETARVDTATKGPVTIRQLALSMGTWVSFGWPDTLSGINQLWIKDTEISGNLFSLCTFVVLMSYSILLMLLNCWAYLTKKIVILALIQRQHNWERGNWIWISFSKLYFNIYTLQPDYNTVSTLNPRHQCYNEVSVCI